jgi:hypothetical protein
VFTGSPVKEVEVAGAGPGGKDVKSMLVEVTGRPHYCGFSVFTVEPNDPLAAGFLPK